MKVIKPFLEKFDNKYAYTIDKEYPRDGWTPPKGRIEALQAALKSKYNSIGDQFLEVKKMVDDDADKPKRGRPPLKKD